jgi:hypothetical protein
MSHISYYDEVYKGTSREEAEEMTRWVIRDDQCKVVKPEENDSGSLKPLKVQYGGQHYKGKAIQPIEYVLANNLGFCEGNVVKYVTRYADKGGVEDLQKAKHYLEFLIEHHSSKGS